MKNGRILAYLSMMMIAGVLCGFILNGVYHDINKEKKPVLEISHKEKTVTSNTPIVYEKEYTKCGHTIISGFEHSKDLFGKDLISIQRKYSLNQGYLINWKGDTLVIKHKIDGFCPQDKGSYRLKEYQGRVAVYRGVEEEEVLERVTAIRMDLLSATIQKDIRAGKFEFRDKDALNDALENFDEYL
jgi:hypothetical protein